MKKFKLIWVCLFLAIILNCPAFCQSHPNSIYFEAFGNGVIYSVNYDRMIFENIGVRIGFMYFAADWFAFFNDVELFLFPITLNFLVGSGNHKLELGAGLIIISGSTGIFGSDAHSGSGVAGTATIGYRYQKNEGGFMWRIGFTPLFSEGEFDSWGGISLGFSF